MNIGRVPFSVPISDDQFVYNGLGNLTDMFQDHAGAIPAGTTYTNNPANVPDVHYDYSDNLADNDDRLVDEVYPNRRVLVYNYNGEREGASHRRCKYLLANDLWLG